LLDRAAIERLARSAGLEMSIFKRFLWGANQLAVLRKPT
jgi:hypothetical protein